MPKKLTQFLCALTPRQMFDVFFTSLAMFIGVYLRWNSLEIIIFGFFVWIIINPLPSRYLAIPGLGLLAITPVFMIFGQQDISEKIAIYAYYFLVMSVLMAIYELRKSDSLNNISH